MEVTASEVLAQAQPSSVTPSPQVTDPKGAPQVTEEAPKPELKEQLSPRFAQLAHREKKIQVKDREVKAREQQLVEREGRISQFEEAKSKGDIPKALELLGLSYDQITNFFLNGEKPTPEMTARQAARAEIEAERKRQEEERKKSTEETSKKAREEYEQTLQEYREKVNTYISDNAATYELIELHEANEVVLATIEQHYQDTKEILTEQAACDLVEKYLEDRVEKATQTKKFQAKAQPQPKADNSPSKSAPPRTLNNQLTPSANTSRPLSREERIKRALAVGRS